MRPRSACPIVFVLCCVFLIGNADFASGAGETPFSSPADTSTNGEKPYRVGRGDVLEINVWKEPLLSGEVVVRNDGMISLALIGDLRAAGRSFPELRDEIQQKLGEFVESPTVAVILKGAVSQKFYVIGEVKSPGEYELTKDLSIVQAIARAGGFAEWADKSGIILIRKENGTERRMRINYKDIVKGKDMSQNIPLQADDTLVVP